MKNAMRYFKFGTGLSLVAVCIFQAFGERGTALPALGKGDCKPGAAGGTEGSAPYAPRQRNGTQGDPPFSGATTPRSHRTPRNNRITAPVAGPPAFSSTVLAMEGHHSLPHPASDASPPGTAPRGTHRTTAGKRRGSVTASLAPAETRWVDAWAAGNSLVVYGQRVEIERMVPSLENGGTDLEAVVTPDPSASRSGGTVTGQTESASGILRRGRSGFSDEEQLFRARWGWTTYDHAGRAAFAVSP